LILPLGIVLKGSVIEPEFPDVALFFSRGLIILAIDVGANVEGIERTDDCNVFGSTNEDNVEPNTLSLLLRRLLGRGGGVGADSIDTDTAGVGGRGRGCAGGIGGRRRGGGVGV
jgi:hypothetical protein